MCLLFLPSLFIWLILSKEGQPEKLCSIEVSQLLFLVLSDILLFHRVWSLYLIFYRSVFYLLLLVLILLVCYDVITPFNWVRPIIWNWICDAFMEDILLGDSFYRLFRLSVCVFYHTVLVAFIKHVPSYNVAL